MSPLYVLLSEINSVELPAGMVAMLLAIIIFSSILLSALFGFISAKMMNLPSVSYKKSFLANLCDFAVNIIIQFIYLMLPLVVQESHGLSIFSLFVGFFIMSYLYAYFFKIAYKKGMLVTLITAAMAVVVFLVIVFIVNLLN